MWKLVQVQTGTWWPLGRVAVGMKLVKGGCWVCKLVKGSCRYESGCWLLMLGMQTGKG